MLSQHRMLQSAQFADLTLACRGHTWKLHKFVVAARSGFFRAALCGGFAEAQNSTIDLPEDESEIIARLLLHIYIRTYPDLPCEDLRLQSSTFRQAPDNDAEDQNDEMIKLFRPLHLAADLYAAAVKYGVHSLQGQACRGARKGFLALFREHELRDTSELRELVRNVYITTPDSYSRMRDTVLDAIICHDLVSESREYLQLLEDIPRFAYDLLVCTSVSKWVYSTCGSKSQDVLVKPCGCYRAGQVCERRECVEKYIKDSVCWLCDGEGALMPRGFSKGF